ncbi:Clavaminate synthase-like protein [Acrodontium crateriforme]|uniref:Clavaminate synthase-like protein n=1 Tax=Acrodontium crateriforme TaxID=150365 RepID=A0AAQ3M837_9PEZI|nr:Clavaminate synthase-like protein [Acrodontium crateriforme]
MPLATTTTLPVRKKRQETEKLENSLPDVFPPQIKSSLVWDGRSLATSYDWNYVLTSSDLAEIDSALRRFKGLEISLGHITEKTFPLPNLHSTLREILKEVHLGHGFKVIRGVPVDNYTREENIIIYAGLSSHVAPIRGRQDHQFNRKPADVVLAHIKDLSSTLQSNQISAPAYTSDKQVFHTDVGDLIALFSLGEAAEGGQSYLSSSWHVYNELAATRPDLIRVLSEIWVVEEFGKRGKTHSLRPLLYHQAATKKSSERLIIQYARRYFTGYWGLPRSPDIPPITEAQAEALDALHFTAEKYAASLDFHKGDIQFVNNLSILHARNGFRDSEEKQRHLRRPIDMPRKEETYLHITKLHPSFAAQVKGVDFSKPIPSDIFKEIHKAITKYGVVKFPKTGLDDAGHVAFAAHFGELDDVTPYTKLGKKHRLPFVELFDISNLLDDGSIAPLDSHRAAMNKGNSLFHVDSSFNPRRAGYSLLRAHTLPPPGTGGATEYADTRAAFEDLPDDLKRELKERDYVACHSLYHSRKTAAPEALPGLNPEEHFMSRKRHRLIQRHEPSGRMNLYVASHIHHIEGVSDQKSRELIETLYKHACDPKYVVSIEVGGSPSVFTPLNMWTENTDLILWDNTCVMHRATGGTFEGRYVRDMRRATVHDSSSYAWGLNEQSNDRMGYP